MGTIEVEPQAVATLVRSVSAVLLISADAARLAAFYRSALGLALEEEVHEGVPLHYACDLGGVHFAIHPNEGWPGAAGIEPQSPVIALGTTDAELAARRLGEAGIEHTGVSDHGFALVVAFRDPDGNHVELLQNRENGGE
jgi:catechol 2,3-dioxygenase-like lactoylglutathione lyase family enzyme